MYIWDIAGHLSFIHRDNGFKHCRLIVAGGGGNGGVGLADCKQSVHIGICFYGAGVGRSLAILLFGMVSLCIRALQL